MPKKRKILKENSQAYWVLKHLRDEDEITSWIAIEEYGITRLSSVIYNLKKYGYPIATEKRTRVNRYGNSVTYTIYSLGLV